MTMTKESILDNEMAIAMDNNPFSLNKEGKLYKSIISAMEIYANHTTKNLATEVLVMIGKPTNGHSHFLAAESVTAAVDDISNFTEPDLTTRQKQFYAAAEKVRNEINFDKHGAITESFFRFANEMNGVTYTELNMFYYNLDYKTYDSFKNRGGSLTKHLASLRNYGKRLYSGESKKLYKENKYWLSSK